MNALAFGQLLILFLALSSVWYGLMGVAYHALLTHGLTSPSADKAVQYFFLLSMGLLPCVGAILSKRFLAPVFAKETPDVFRSPNRWKHQDTLAILLSLCLFAVMTHRPRSETADLVDDGPRLASVSAFLDGKTPYRDFLIPYGFFQEVAQPLIAFRLWGQTYASYLRLDFDLKAVAAMFLFGLCCFGTSSVAATLFTGVVLLSRTDWSVPDRLLLAVLSILSLGLGFRTGQRGWAFASGMAAIACLEYSLDIGLPLGLGVTSYFLVAWITSSKDNRRDSDLLGLTRAWWAGALSATLLFLAWVTAVGGLQAWITDLCRLLAHRQSTWSDGLPSHLFIYPFLAHPQSLSTFAYIHDVPFLAMAVVLVLLVKKKSGPVTYRWHLALLLSTVVFFQFFIYIGRSDFTHWKTATVFILPLSAMILDEILRWPFNAGLAQRERWVLGVLVVLSAIPFGLAFAGRQSLWVSAFNQFSQAASSPMVGDLDGSRLGPSADPDQRTLLINTVDAIQEIVPKDGYFYDFSNQGVFYFLSNRKNPTRFGMVDELADPVLFSEFQAEMAAHPPQAVLAIYRNNTLWTIPAVFPVRDYLEARYTVKTYWPKTGWVLLVPKTSRLIRR